MVLFITTVSNTKNPTEFIPVFANFIAADGRQRKLEFNTSKEFSHGEEEIRADGLSISLGVCEK
jgi:hypothetical protein